MYCVLASSRIIRRKSIKPPSKRLKCAKRALFSAVCDWIVSGLQLVMGTLRVMAGDVVGGMATIMNGVTGVIKASAETALLCGADKETCAKVIGVATLLQTVFGAMSMMGSMASAGNIKDAVQAVGGSKFFTYLRIANNGVEGANQTQQSGTSMALADLQKQIEELMAISHSVAMYNNGLKRVRQCNIKS